MDGLTEIIPRLNAALTQARGSDLARIGEALMNYGVTGVHGEPEVGKTTLVRAAIRNAGTPPIRVDLDGVTDHGGVVWLVANQFARSLVGPHEMSLATLPDGLRPSSAGRARVELADRLGPRVAALALSEAPVDASDVQLEEVLDLLAEESRRRDAMPPLWIDHLETPGLVPRHPVDVAALLWTVRSVLQEAEMPIILSGAQSATSLAHGSESAFHGDGSWVTVGRPGRDAWRHVAEEAGGVSAGWMDQFVELTHSHPVVTLIGLATRPLLGSGRHDPLSLWQHLVALDDGMAARSVQHARQLHRLGAQVLSRIAQGRGPYEEAGSKRVRNEINKSVNRLHQAGLVTRPSPRAWQLTNPLLAARLRGTMPLTVAEARGTAALDDFDAW